MHKIKPVKISDLMKYFKSEEVLGYCSKCPNHGKIWSCPPHNFDIKKYLNNYKFAHIICLKIDISHINDKKESIELFHQKRKLFNKNLLSLEAKFESTKVLFSGECYLCNPCRRINNLPCNNKNIRYSLESLGLNVSDICENILDEKLEWKENMNIKYLRSIGAILSQEKLNINTIG
jgi:predicted metal-binding protein